MKLIYVFNDEVKEEFLEKGLKLIQQTVIGEKKAYVFENNKNVFLNKYDKNQIMLSNQMFF